jgi:hypothetical protein
MIILSDGCLLSEYELLKPNTDEACGMSKLLKISFTERFYVKSFESFRSMNSF